MRVGRLQYDGFEIDPDGCQVYRGEVEVALEPRTFDLLLYFVARPERLISRDELVARVWQARALSEGVLASTVAKLRKALGQAPEAREPLETVRGRGYRWHARPQAPVSAAEDPFVARAAPLARMLEALERAAAGTGQLILVSGEAGMGKTRLLRELEKRARAGGWSVWRGAGHDGVATPAYWPWVEILRAAYLQLTESGWRRHRPREHAALAQLVPELDEVSTSGALAAPQTLRFRLFDELTRFVQSCSREAPCLIAIDDLHWADVATFELLAYAAGALERHPVVLVAALRPYEIVDGAVLNVLQRLQRSAATVAIEGLSDSEVGELIAALDGEHAGSVAALRQGLFARTQGNPLFVRETLRLLRQQPGRSLTELELPPVVRGVIARRIALLGDDTQRVLTAAAVAGTEFDAYAVAELLERPLEHVLHALEPARQMRIVEPAGAWQFVFTHGLVRDVLYAALGSAQAGALHGRLARALAGRGAAVDARQLVAVAHHFSLAVPSELAASVTHGLTAAAVTRASSGYEAAAAILARVVRKHESESDDLLERCELLLALASDLSCAGDMRAAWQSLQRGSELARQLGAAELLARFAFALAPWLEYGGGDDGYVRALQLEVLQSLGAGAPGLRARLLAQRARLELERPWAERVVWLDEAERLAGPEPTPELERQLAYARAMIHVPQHLAGTQQAVARFRVLDAQAPAQHSDPLQLREAINVELRAYTSALAACDLPIAERALVHARALAREMHTMNIDYMLDLVEAGRALATGQLATLEACAHRLRESSSSGGGFELAWKRYGILLLYELGLLDGPRMPREQVRQHVPTMTPLPSHRRLEGELFLAWMYVKLGDHAAAQSELAGIDPELVARMPLRLEHLAPLCMLSETQLQLADHAGVERLLVQLEPFAGLNAIGPTFDYLGSVAHYLGQLTASLGRRAEACRYLEEAEAVNARLGMPLQLARTRTALARVRKG